MNVRLTYPVNAVHGPVNYVNSWYFLSCPTVINNCQRNSYYTGTDNFDNSFTARNPSGEDSNSMATSTGLRESKPVLVWRRQLRGQCKWIITYDEQLQDS